jgi:hypothetical protein
MAACKTPNATLSVAPTHHFIFSILKLLLRHTIKTGHSQVPFNRNFNETQIPDDDPCSNAQNSFLILTPDTDNFRPTSAVKHFLTILLLCRIANHAKSYETTPARKLYRNDDYRHLHYQHRLF